MGMRLGLGIAETGWISIASDGPNPNGNRPP